MAAEFEIGSRAWYFALNPKELTDEFLQRLRNDPLLNYATGPGRTLADDLQAERDNGVTPFEGRRGSTRAESSTSDSASTE